MTHYHLTCHREALRAAIAINNIGCSLLERGCYTQAHQTLGDAARAAVLLLGDRGYESHRSVASKLAAADRRLAFPEIVSPRGCQDGKDKSPVPLRINFDEANEDQHSDLVVMSAIAVHNSALSCYYQSRIESDSPLGKRKRLLSKATILLKSSYCLIADCPESAPYATLSCALHILENLHLVALSSSPSAPTTCAAATASFSGSHPEEAPGLVVAEGDRLLALEEELARLRWTTQAVERADVHFFGRPESTAAAA